MSEINTPLTGAGSQAAGFPSPADDYVEKKLDLNELLIGNKQATFFMRASGNAMTGAGIHDDDILIVDRSLTAAHRKIVVAALDGELLVRRLLRSGAGVTLTAENSDYASIEVSEDISFEIWGVVTRVIHAV